MNVVAAMIAEVITPLMFAPSACGRMIAPDWLPLRFSARSSPSSGRS